jgi:hypothetical protein
MGTFGCRFEGVTVRLSLTGREHLGPFVSQEQSVVIFPLIYSSRIGVKVHDWYKKGKILGFVKKSVPDIEVCM